MESGNGIDIWSQVRESGNGIDILLAGAENVEMARKLSMKKLNLGVSALVFAVIITSCELKHSVTSRGKRLAAEHPKGQQSNERGS